MSERLDGRAPLQWRLSTLLVALTLTAGHFAAARHYPGWATLSGLCTVAVGAILVARRDFQLSAGVAAVIAVFVPVVVALVAFYGYVSYVLVTQDATAEVGVAQLLVMGGLVSAFVGLFCGGAVSLSYVTLIFLAPPLLEFRPRRRSPLETLCEEKAAAEPAKEGPAPELVATASQEPRPRPKPAPTGRYLTLRLVLDRGATLTLLLVVLVALLPFASLGYTTLRRGLEEFRFAMLWEPMAVPLADSGGFGPAVRGSLTMLMLALLMSAPLSLLVGAVIAKRSNLAASSVRLLLGAMVGFPGILASVFTLLTVVRATGGYSAFAGAVALAIVMTPTMCLITDTALANALGTRASVAFSTALKRSVTGILGGWCFGLSRGVAATAPLLLTALFSNESAGLMEPAPALSTLVYAFSASPFANQLSAASAAAMLLLLMALLLQGVGQLLRNFHLARLNLPSRSWQEFRL